MSFEPPLKLGYALLVVQGLLGVLAPRKAIAVATGVWRLGFENVGDLEPREWYVEVTRVTGVGMLVAGLTGLLVAASGDDGTDETDEDDAPVDGDSDGPVQVNLDG